MTIHFGIEVKTQAGWVLLEQTTDRAEAYRLYDEYLDNFVDEIRLKYQSWSY